MMAMCESHKMIPTFECRTCHDLERPMVELATIGVVDAAAWVLLYRASEVHPHVGRAKVRLAARLRSEAMRYAAAVLRAGAVVP